MLDFRFSNTQNGRNQDSVGRLLVQPRLWIPHGDYPAHTEWRDKALAEIATGRKRTMLAYWGPEAVGSIVYQQHPQDSTKVEIRNLSIEPHARGRHVASFLLRQVEEEAVVDFPGATTIVADTKRANTGILNFVLRNGYTIDGVALLTDSAFAHNGEPDVLLSKRLVA